MVQIKKKENNNKKTKTKTKIKPAKSETKRKQRRVLARLHLIGSIGKRSPDRPIGWQQQTRTLSASLDLDWAIASTGRIYASMKVCVCVRECVCRARDLTKHDCAM